MPQDASLILNQSEVSGDVGRIIFYKGSAATPAFPGYIEHSPMLNEPGEAPITLLLSETVMGCVMNIEAGVVGVPQDQCELHTTAPVLGDLVRLEPMLQVDGGLINVVAMREE
jgi:hypothetical protein